VPRHTLGKEERLKSRKKIDQLFAQGKKLRKYPLATVYLTDPLTSKFSTQFTPSVPHKNFKRAVDRNLLKRRMREAFRKNNTSLKEHCSEKNVLLSLMVIYQDKSIQDYQTIESSMISIINELIQNI